MELNSLNNFSRDLCKEHPCTVSTILGQVFKEKKLFKEIVDARPHGRMNHGQQAITKAYLEDIVFRLHVAKNSYRISTVVPEDQFIMAGRINS